MANFAVLSGDIVFNVIVADTLADAEIGTQSVCIEIPEGSSAGIGDTWDESSKSWIFQIHTPPLIVDGEFQV